MQPSEQQVARAIIQQLESLERAGVKVLKKGVARPLPPVSTRGPISAPPTVAQAQSPPSPSTTRPAASAPVGSPVTTPPSTVLQSAKSTAPANLPPKPGVTSMPKSKAKTVSQPAELLANADLPSGPPLPASERLPALELLQTEVSGCTRCDELATTRTQTVFGAGNPNARLCFLGEAPGADEDAQGVPFVGRAGQLLTKIIEACTLRREDIYILNTLKCRPPQNRNPAPTEMANCRGYLDAQLDIIRPEYICCLGSIAAKGLLQTETTIGRLRGKFYTYRGAKVLCTYHPAYLLRNPSAKKDVWEDMQLLMAEMGIPLKQ